MALRKNLCLTVLIVGLCLVACQPFNDNQSLSENWSNSSTNIIATSTSSIENVNISTVTAPTREITQLPIPSSTIDTNELAVSICAWDYPEGLYYHREVMETHIEDLMLTFIYGHELNYGRFAEFPHLIVDTSPIEISDVEVKDGEYYYGSGLTPHVGESILVPQARRTIQIKPDAFWSDGTPVTAHDSVFAFEHWFDPELPLLIDFSFTTVSYMAVDSKTIEWVGAPGYIPIHEFQEFWVPLPSHLWEGIDAPTIFDRISPVNFGSFFVSDYKEDEYIELQQNPYYDWELESNLRSITSIVILFSADKEAANLLYEDKRCDIMGIDDMNMDWFMEAVYQLVR